MNLHILTSIVLVAFILLVGFGLYIPTTNHGGHEMGCPFASGSTAICAAPLAHLEHWQSTFVTILAETLLLAVVLLFFSAISSIPKIDPQHERYRLRAHIPTRPTLFQELYSGGIVNRKEPQIFL
jgi:hypothetical protein